MCLAPVVMGLSFSETNGGKKDGGDLNSEHGAALVN